MRNHNRPWLDELGISSEMVQPPSKLWIAVMAILVVLLLLLGAWLDGTERHANAYAEGWQAGHDQGVKSGRESMSGVASGAYSVGVASCAAGRGDGR